MKCSGENVILRGIFHEVIMFSITFHVISRRVWCYQNLMYHAMSNNRLCLASPVFCQTVSFKWLNPQWKEVLGFEQAYWHFWVCHGWYCTVIKLKDPSNCRWHPPYIATMFLNCSKHQLRPQIWKYQNVGSLELYLIFESNFFLH